MKDVFDQLAESSKKAEKINILKNLSSVETELFKEISKLALSHYHNFYLTEDKLPRINHTASLLLESVDLNTQLCDLIDFMRVASESGVGFNNKDRKQELTNFLRIRHPDVTHIAKLILKRNLQCGVAAKLVNEVWPGTVFEKKYQRYSLLTEDNMSTLEFPVISEIKKDAKFVNIVNTTDTRMFSRDWVDNTETYLGQHIERVTELFKCTTEKYGELVLHGEVGVFDEKTGKFIDRATSNGILNSAVSGIQNLRVDLWDCVPYDDFFGGRCDIPYHERRALLEDVISDVQQQLNGVLMITLCDSKLIYNMEDLEQEFISQTSAGEEGIMAKGANNPWADGTSTIDFKLKKVAACELKVVGETEGRNKYKGKVGAVICESSCGMLQTKVSGLTDAQREPGYFSNGDILEVAFNDVTKAKSKGSLYSLSSPRIIERRTDKHEADDLPRIYDHLKNASFFIKQKVNNNDTI